MLNLCLTVYLENISVSLKNHIYAYFLAGFVFINWPIAGNVFSEKYAIFLLNC